jgi:hypothetical protein
VMKNELHPDVWARLGASAKIEADDGKAAMNQALQMEWEGQQTIMIQCTPREVKELRSVLTEFLADCHFFLAEGQDQDEARRLHRQRQRADRWWTKLLIARATAKPQRKEKKHEKKRTAGRAQVR